MLYSKLPFCLTGLGQTATVPMVGVQQGGMVGVQQGGMVGVQQGGMVGVQQGGMVGVQATTPLLQVVSGVSSVLSSWYLNDQSTAASLIRKLRHASQLTHIPTPGVKQLRRNSSDPPEHGDSSEPDRPVFHPSGGSDGDPGDGDTCPNGHQPLLQSNHDHAGCQVRETGLSLPSVFFSL